MGPFSRLSSDNCGYRREGSYIPLLRRALGGDGLASRLRMVAASPKPLPGWLCHTPGQQDPLIVGNPDIRASAVHIALVRISVRANLEVVDRVNLPERTAERCCIAVVLMVRSDARPMTVVEEQWAGHPNDILHGGL